MGRRERERGERKGGRRKEEREEERKREQEEKEEEEEERGGRGRKRRILKSYILTNRHTIHSLLSLSPAHTSTILLYL